MLQKVKIKKEMSLSHWCTCFYCTKLKTIGQVTCNEDGSSPDWTLICQHFQETKRFHLFRDRDVLTIIPPQHSYIEAQSYDKLKEAIM